MTASLPDVNLFFALLHPRHADHGRAQSWLGRRSEPHSIRVCRVVQMGALRLLTSPSVMREDLITPQEAWAGYAESMQGVRFLFVEEPDGLEAVWRTLTDVPRGLVRIDTDTYLAAFALAGGHTLATFDRGFVRFAGLQADIL